MLHSELGNRGRKNTASRWRSAALDLKADSDIVLTAFIIVGTVGITAVIITVLLTAAVSASVSSLPLLSVAITVIGIIAIVNKRDRIAGGKS